MTLTDFIAYVKRDLKRTDKDTEITRAYNDSLRWIAAKLPVGDMKFTSYVQTTIGVEDYELPCNLMHLFHPVRIIDGTGDNDQGYPLQLLTKEEYSRAEPNPNRNNPATSKPWGYCPYSRSLLVTSVPDKSTYILEFDWSKRPAVQAAGVDIPVLGEEYEEVLKHMTLERVYEGLQQYDIASFWGAKYHQRDAAGRDMPAGMLLDLFEAEKDRESRSIGEVENNCL